MVLVLDILDEEGPEGGLPVPGLEAVGPDTLQQVTEGAHQQVLLGTSHTYHGYTLYTTV